MVNELRQSQPHGPISQNAFIVADLDEAIHRWARVMHVGPFIKLPPQVFDRAQYRGKAQVVKFEVALAYSGDLLIELIKPESASIFKEFLDSGGVGVQHFGAFTEDFGAARTALEGRGGRCIQSSDLPDGSRIAYFDMGGPPPSIFEIAYLVPNALAFFAMIKAAADKWDGVAETFTL